MYLGRFRRPVNACVDFIRSLLPELNFITIHYAYFISTSLITALIMWGSATPFRSLRFIDAYFLTTSAMTEAGLNTVNISTLNTWQQVMLFALMMLGSAIFVSIAVLLVRVKAFEEAFREEIKRKKDHRRRKRMRDKGLTEDSESTLDTIDESKDTSQIVPESSIVNGATHVPNGPLKLQIPNTSQAQTTAIETDEKAMATGNTILKSPTNDSDRKTRFVVPEKPERRSTNMPGQTPISPKSQPNTPPSQSPIIPIKRSNTAFSRVLGNEPRNVPDHLRKPLFSFSGVGAAPTSNLRARAPTYAPRPSEETEGLTPLSRARSLSHYARPTDPWFESDGGYFTHNSQVHGLTFDERERLGGCEYAAILFLSFLVPAYFFAWQILGAIALGAWVNNNRPGIPQGFDINPWWAGAFTAISGFNNSGMMLVDTNMIPFQNAVFLLLSVALFILAGNTAYPIFLRFIIWIMWKCLPDLPSTRFDKQTLRFLLDHPRRCYTNLFPSRHTWFLSIALVVLNGTDWAMFEILNVGRKSITVLSPGIEVLDGFFQAVAVRNGGFIVVPIPSLRIALQVLYVFMMYISAYPVALTMRSSNVYEERSLGIFAEDQPPEPEPADSDDPSLKRTPSAPGRIGNLKRRITNVTSAPARGTRTNFFRYQVRAQLAHDTWWICLSIFLICIIESSQFEADPINFSVFNIIFEVISAYATVGLSVGAVGQNYSFSGQWHTLSKLVMVGVMLRGRHRGLPVAIDSAVQLRPRQAGEAEEEDGRKREMRARAGTMGAGVGFVSSPR